MKGDENMDIAALSMAMAQSQLITDFGTGMLSKSLETFTDIGEDFTKMMEQSVNPELGANIDIRL